MEAEVGDKGCMYGWITGVLIKVEKYSKNVTNQEKGVIFLFTIARTRQKANEYHASVIKMMKERRYIFDRCPAGNY